MEKDPILNICMWEQVCEPLGHLKVKLKRCFSQFLTVRCESGGSVLFKEDKSGSSPSKSDTDNTGLLKCVMARIKEISQYLIRRAADAH